MCKAKNENTGFSQTKGKTMEHYKMALEDLISKLEDSGDDDFSIDEIQDYIDEVIQERKDWEEQHGY